MNWLCPLRFRGERHEAVANLQVPHLLPRNERRTARWKECSTWGEGGKAKTVQAESLLLVAHALLFDPGEQPAAVSRKPVAQNPAGINADRFAIKQ